MLCHSSLVQAYLSSVYAYCCIHIPVPIADNSPSIPSFLFVPKQARQDNLINDAIRKTLKVNSLNGTISKYRQLL
jgi:hypothetical protein